METIGRSGDDIHITHVVVTGSESVGKTTLAQDLATHFHVTLVDEFVRDFALAKGAPLTYSDHRIIAEGQMAREDAGLAKARERGDALLIGDTDLVSTVVYHYHYYERCPAYIEAAAVARLADHYLLLDTDVPWVADGIRDRELQRAEVQALFKTTLDRLNAAYTVIRGSWDSRFTAATRIIEEVQAAFTAHDH